MSDRMTAIMEFKRATAQILNLAANELPEGGKLALARALQGDVGSLRLHVALEPFAIVGAIFPVDGSTPPVKVFELYDVPSTEGASH